MRAARQIIEETGDEGRVTLSEVARRVGITAPSIYAHFRNTAELCQAAVADCWRIHEKAVLESIDSTAELQTQIAQWANSYVAFARENWGIYRALHARENTRPVPETAQRAQGSLNRLVAAIAFVRGLPSDSAQAYEAALGLWFDLHAIATLPPAHPRFQWPDDRSLIDLALRRSGIPVSHADS